MHRNIDSKDSPLSKITISKVFSLIIIVVILLVVVVDKYFFVGAENPEEFLRNKYSNKPGYSIQVQKSSDHYSGFIGKDEENIYLDLFSDGKYFGGSMASIEQGDTIWDYQFQQHETLIVVWGYNSNSKYLSYSLEVSSATAEPKIIKKDIARESYILDIYVLDTKYNSTANLELIKRTGE